MRKTFRTWAAGCVLVLGLAKGGATGSADGAAPIVRLRSRAAAGTVARSVAGARRRLDRPACQRLFSEFTDGRGHSLADALAAEGASGSEHLARLVFYDGESHRQCRREATLAFTAPNSHVVLLCARFMELSRRDPVLAEAIVIHETLHSLGLGENPPASAEITARVLRRCKD